MDYLAVSLIISINILFLCYNVYFLVKQKLFRRALVRLMTFEDAPDSPCEYCIDKCSEECTCICHKKRSDWFMMHWYELKLKAGIAEETDYR